MGASLHAPCSPVRPAVWNAGASLKELGVTGLRQAEGQPGLGFCSNARGCFCGGVLMVSNAMTGLGRGSEN